MDKLREGSAEVKFIARISKMGEKLIIVVPMDHHKEIKSLKGKQVIVKVDDEI
jgi:antitoxin component of MazEF toxin-antitoxin module